MSTIASTPTNTPASLSTTPRTEKADLQSPAFHTEEIEQELVSIERERTTRLALPDTSVYQRIAENTRQCVKVQLAILGSAGDAVESSQKDRIEERLEARHQIEDAPYYSYAIGEYSLLLSAASIRVSTLIGHDTTVTPAGQNPMDDMATIRRSPLEATCDAIFVTAAAILRIAKAKDKQASSSMNWDELESAIRVERLKDQHITRKTESAHRTLCNVLHQCIQTLDHTGKSREALVSIENDRDRDLTKANDNFFRIAAYSEAEVHLLVLLARSLER
jgi:hypothetical protein